MAAGCSRWPELGLLRDFDTIQAQVGKLRAGVRRFSLSNSSRAARCYGNGKNSRLHRHGVHFPD